MNTAENGIATVLHYGHHEAYKDSDRLLAAAGDSFAGTGIGRDQFLLEHGHSTIEHRVAGYRHCSSGAPWRRRYQRGALSQNPPAFINVATAHRAVWAPLRTGHLATSRLPAAWIRAHRLRCGIRDDSPPGWPRTAAAQPYRIRLVARLGIQLAKRPYRQAGSLSIGARRDV